MINLSEGEKERRINEATGKASEIEALAEATATSIDKLSEAISQESGKEAINMSLAQQYLTNISKLSNPKNDVIIPINLSDFEEILKRVDIAK